MSLPQTPDGGLEEKTMVDREYQRGAPRLSCMDQNHMNFDFLLALGGELATAVSAGLASLGGATVMTIRADRLDWAGEIAAKAKAKAEKLGVEPLRFATLGTRMVARPREGGGTRWVEMATIALWGAAPKVAGYALLARVEHTEAGNLVSRSPIGAEGIDLDAFRTAAPHCAHCGVARRRKDTFVLRGQDGALVQVGRNCLADFIRSEDIKMGLQLWQLLMEFSAGGGEGDEEGGFGGGRGDRSPGTLSYLAHAVAAVRVDGFHKSDADRATKNTIGFATARRPTHDASSAAFWDDLQPTVADAERAAVVLAWCAGQAGTSDYEHNLRVACSLPQVGRSYGLLASAPSAYARHVEGLVRKAREAAQTAQNPGHHVGEIGKRLALGDLTVLRVRYSESMYGTTTIVALVDAQGNRMTWFASGAQNLDAGTVLHGCKATPKKHGEFKGTPDTTLSRLAWASETKATATVAA